MNRKMLGGIVILVVLIGIAGFFLLIGQNTDTEPKKVYNPLSKEAMQKVRDGLAARKAQEAAKPPPPGASPNGHWHDGVWHDGTHTTAPNKAGQLSTNPFLMNEIPEHLKMPPEWYNFHYMEAYDDEESKEKFEKRLKTIIEEVIENYNPKRPIEDVWPTFIEAEKRYNAESPYSHLNPGVPGLGGYRGDWLYKQVWDFPEVFEIILYEEPEIDGSAGMWLDVYQIETGLLGPDWNRFNLPDGRVFRAKHGYKYQFNLRYDKERGVHRSSVSFCRSDGSTAKLVVIDLDTISDEELELLSGRDYNINPYTGKPIAYPGRKH